MFERVLVIHNWHMILVELLMTATTYYFVNCKCRTYSVIDLLKQLFYWSPIRWDYFMRKLFDGDTDLWSMISIYSTCARTTRHSGIIRNLFGRCNHCSHLAWRPRGFDRETTVQYYENQRMDFSPCVYPCGNENIKRGQLCLSKLRRKLETPNFLENSDTSFSLTHQSQLPHLASLTFWSQVTQKALSHSTTTATVSVVDRPILAYRLLQNVWSQIVTVNRPRSLRLTLRIISYLQFYSTQLVNYTT